MKEIVLELQLQDCSAQQYFQCIYNDDEVMRQYHAEVDKDEFASVTPWQDGQRTVTFVMDMAIPATLRRFIGAEPIRVCEKQTMTWQPDGSFTLLSEPTMDITGGASFTTAVEAQVSDAPGGGCRVVQLVRCSASLPWPMQGTVEAIMADAAKPAIQKFLDFCARVIAARRAQQAMQAVVQEAAINAAQVEVGTSGAGQQLQPAIGARAQQVGQQSPTPGGVGEQLNGEAASALLASMLAQQRPPGIPTAEELEDFYDAFDALSDTQSVRGSSQKPYTTHQLDVLLQRLQVMCQGTENTNRHLESISKSLQHIDGVIGRAAAYQEGLQQGRLAAVASSVAGMRSLLIASALSAVVASSLTVFFMQRRKNS